MARPAGSTTKVSSRPRWAWRRLVFQPLAKAGHRSGDEVAVHEEHLLGIGIAGPHQRIGEGPLEHGNRRRRR